jgi:hypothetical protein
MHLISPKTFPNLEPFRKSPLFFLAGPVLGGGDWHLPMTTLLMTAFKELIVANPTWYREAHPLDCYRMDGQRDHFPNALAWERYYLDQAAIGWPAGCIIFWLAEESRQEPRKDGSPFAIDTRGELGEWRGQLIHAPHLRVVVGAEPGFPGLRVIKRNFEMAVPGFRIYDTMQEVVERARYFADPANSFSARVEK